MCLLLTNSSVSKNGLLCVVSSDDVMCIRINNTTSNHILCYFFATAYMNDTCNMRWCMHVPAKEELVH